VKFKRENQSYSIDKQTFLQPVFNNWTSSRRKYESQLNILYTNLTQTFTNNLNELRKFNLSLIKLIFPNFSLQGQQTLRLLQLKTNIKWKQNAKTINKN